YDRARNAASYALQRARESDLLALAATAQWRMAEAQKALGRHDEAEHAIRSSRDLLDLACERIDDSEIRRTFLEQPAFNPIRDSRQAGSEERRLGALYEIIHALNSGTDPETVLASILDSALQVLQAERGMILLRDSEAEEFTVRVARNLEK